MDLFIPLFTIHKPSIEANHKKDVRRCFQECLTLWLSKAEKVSESGDPTLDSLIDALNTIEETFTAEKIKEFSELFIQL